MFCAISGEVPEEPVISKKTGYIYEKRLITKYIKTEGKCPVSGEELDLTDLVDVKTQPIVKPKPVAASSIPGMLVSLQNEWDSMMLETFTLKKHLQAVRQELSQALYQHEAACRVIARLIKERDAAREALANAQAAPVSVPASSSASASMEVEDKEEITDAMIGKMTKFAKASFKARPKRQIPDDLCTEETMAKWTAQASYTSHKTATPVVNVIAQRPSQPDRILSGGADGQVLLYDLEAKKIARRFTGFTAGVNALILHPEREVVVAAGNDKTVRLWVNEEKPTVFKHHQAEVTGLSLQPCGDFFASCSLDGSWHFYDIDALRMVQSVHAAEAMHMTTMQFHPDGLIVATGTSEGIVQVWDMKSQTNVTNFTDHATSITSLAFSENGYTMASAAEDGEVKIWDLRNGSCLQTVAMDSHVFSVNFDYSGVYLGVGAENKLAVFNSKSWKAAWTCDEEVGGFHSVLFGERAQYLLAACGNRSVVKYY